MKKEGVGSKCCINIFIYKFYVLLAYIAVKLRGASRFRLQLPNQMCSVVLNDRGVPKEGHSFFKKLPEILQCIYGFQA